MPTYDGEHFDPPAPVAHVTLRTASSKVSDVLMLLDSGADVTLVPRHAVEQLGLGGSSAGEFQLVGFDGSTSTSPVVQLTLLFCDRSFRGQFLVVDEKWGILGRNVLNALPILHDGPRSTWSVSSTR